MSKTEADLTTLAHGQTVLALCWPALDIITPELLSRVLHALEKCGYGALCDTVHIALAEALNNVIEHGYRDMQGGAIAVRVAGHDNGVTIEVNDWGLPLSTLPEGVAPDPRDLCEGGYGWFLIRTLVTELRYVRHGDRNCLTLYLCD
ncbi:ATP-binding protein [Marivita sp. S2033]|uniref:ATP-binding protein n=1 Tax=Marivita sp. S2033 TaxID=3373187 RepID=UPI003981C665